MNEKNRRKMALYLTMFVMLENVITGDEAKHLEKVLPITPWTSLNLSGDNDIEREKVTSKE